MRNFLVIFSVLFAYQLHAEENINIKKALAEHLNEQLPNYEVAYFDFNSDGVKDAFIYINGSNWCGSGGCTSFVFSGTTNGFKFQSKSMITNKPILVTSTKTNGWYNLVVNTGGIGQVVLTFDGKSYPLNPSMQPKVKEKQLSSVTTILK
ncbi:hypothetical protein C1E24_20610 [Pseudoalteromonas phenolica]|uniref:Uncharacterized protein n=1 Tax=Pseudoalteromonas phenolica TaxID=161398 RepID=A0A5R9PXT6_9GAMM|nr:hypothetical protein [Pseudoalteromonas phenolica]TLX45116.1 hypothetical protein C1E24_20610 [Pseudoalteromonas phenolica]